jgi:hypothetical protein
VTGSLEPDRRLDGCRRGMVGQDRNLPFRNHALARMIPKSGNRFSEKIMLKQRI